jgi:tetratricopeptide (TPR) repeat protein
MNSYAQEKINIPEISNHSKLSFAVYQGDTVTMNVVIDGKYKKLNWVRSGTTICRELKCIIDTAQWSLGTHKITFVVQNERGSRTLKFRLRVLSAPPGYSPGEVEPELMDESGGAETIASEDMVIKALTGRGFSYNRDKLHVVRDKIRLINWVEKIRTQKNSTLRISQKDVEEHNLSIRTKVKLETTDSSRRVLQLWYGALRSRQFSGIPGWSITVDDWLQVDTDELGDVLVQRSKGKNIVYVTVLRGSARVYQAAVVDDKGIAINEGRAVVVQAGAQVKIKKSDQSPIRIYQPKGVKVGREIRRTAPQHIPGSEFGKEETESTVVQKNDVPKDLSEAIISAEKSLQTNDYVKALELLLPLIEGSKKNYKANLTIGRAYLGLFMYKYAFEHLKIARTLDEDAAAPFFYTGVMYVGDGKWRKAITYLEQADDLGFEEKQLLHYYLGVAHYYLENSLSAKNSFTYSEWYKQSTVISESVQSFLRESNEGAWLDLRGFVGVIFDSNIPRAGDSAKADLPGNLTGVAGSGYSAGGGFTITPFEESIGHLEFNYDIENRTWANGDYVELDQIDQDFAADFEMGFGGERFEDNYFSIGINAGLALYMIGEDRAMDQLHSNVSLGSPNFYSIKMDIGNYQNLDPLPDNEDILDPILWEMVGIGDRSHRTTSYSLSFVPVNSSELNLGVNIGTASSIMSSELQQDYNHSDSGLDISLDYFLSMRNSFEFEIGYLTRDFPDSEESRSDTKIALSSLWRWYFTTVLSQELKFGYETNSSGSEANTYSRQFYRYSMHLEF